MTTTDEYAAAWIEARGRLQTNAGSTEAHYRPTIRVVSVDPGVPEALKEHFGSGELNYFVPRSAPHMTLYTWQVRGTPAVKALRRTAPHMITDLREDAERALEREEQKARARC